MRLLLTRIAAAIAPALLAIVLAAPGVVAQEPEHSEAGHSTAAEEKHGTGSGPLGIDLDLAVWTGVVFVLLYLVLSRFAWPQIKAALEEREAKIAEQIAAAEARHADAKRLLAEHQATLAAAAGEVRALLEEAKRDAEQTRRTIAAKGHQDAQDELQRAVREIGRARDAAIQELAISSANVAVDLARNVVSTQLTAERQSELVREAMTKLTAAAPSKN